LRDDEHEEPYEGRLSRTDPWERRGEIPLRDPIVGNAADSVSISSENKKNKNEIV